MNALSQPSQAMPDRPSSWLFCWTLIRFCAVFFRPYNTVSSFDFRLPCCYPFSSLCSHPSSSLAFKNENSHITCPEHRLLIRINWPPMFFNWFFKKTGKSKGKNQKVPFDFLGEKWYFCWLLPFDFLIDFLIDFLFDFLFDFFLLIFLSHCLLYRV